MIVLELKIFSLLTMTSKAHRPGTPGLLSVSLFLTVKFVKNDKVYNSCLFPTFVPTQLSS